MERSKNRVKLLLCLFLILGYISNCKSESIYKKMIYTSFVNGEMYKWEGIIHAMEENTRTITLDQKLELISYYYGNTAHLIHKKQYEKASQSCSKGEALIAQLLLQVPQNATAHAYKGAFLGFRIGISKFKSVILGPESEASINKANELEPHNIQAIVDRANLYFYKPSLFGGDKKQALKLYIQAVHLMEKSKECHQNWFYLNTLTSVAKTYEKLDQDLLSKGVYEKILHLEPNFRWVKNELYPALLVKIGR
jgi:tetratricopeptide (TPR) repeat protein